MGAVLQFAKIQTGDDWTPGERVQLREIWSQLATEVEDLEVVFGKSELGDPWCVIGDESGEVMLHVARIAGEFVVHATAADTVAEGFDLWNTVARLLGSSLRDRRGEVLSFPSDSATASTIALFLSIALAGEIGPQTGEFQLPSGALNPLEGEPTNSDRGPIQPAGASEATREHEGQLASAARFSPRHQGPQPHQDQNQAAHHHAPATSTAEANLAHPASTPPSASPSAGEFPAAASSPPTAGGARGVSLVSGPAEATDKTPDLATSRLLVEGSAGPDRLQLSARWVTVGAEGADVFVAEAPDVARADATTIQEPRLLGVIVGFVEAEGDRLEFSKGMTAVAVGARIENDILAHLRKFSEMSTTPEVAGRRIDFDIDGDGSSDAYLLVADPGGGWLAQLRTLPQAHEHPVGLIGAPLSTGAFSAHPGGTAGLGFDGADSPLPHQVPILVPLLDPFLG